jgi:hypothetical protein
LSNAPEKFKSFNLYIQDQSRFGFLTRNGKALTAIGVKPVCDFQHVFKSTYVFGVFSPYNGDSLVMELSKKKPKEYKIMILTMVHSINVKIEKNRKYSITILTTLFP